MFMGLISDYETKTCKFLEAVYHLLISVTDHGYPKKKVLVRNQT